MEEKVIEYKKEDLTVFWKPNTCIHSEKCWRGLGVVFKPKEKPWIQLDGTEVAKIKKQIDQCPSGALSYKSSSQTKENSEKVKAVLATDGPILIKGEILLEDEAGHTVSKINPALCRCGASNNKPYCDGTHKKVGFTSQK